MTKKEILEAMAKVLAGLQVPASINPALLGAAGEPWQELHHHLIGFGWADSDEYATALKGALL